MYLNKYYAKIHHYLFMTKNGEIKPRSRNQWPSLAEKDAFDEWITTRLLQGYNHTKLAELYNKENPDNKITRKHVSHTVSRLREEWRDRTKESMNYYMNQELDRLEVMEVEAWRQYHACNGTVSEEETKELFNHEGQIKESLVVTKTKDDPRSALQWFDKILKIQQDRRKVLRLETTVKINNVMAVKGYAIFNPNQDWPEQNLPEPNVIDAEFSENGS